MKFDGSFSLDAPINKVYTTLIDPKIMAKGLPDLEDLEVIDADHFKAKFKIGILHIKGSVNMDFIIKEKTVNQGATLVVQGTGLQSTIELQTKFSINEIEKQKTMLNWEAEANIKGLLSGIGSKMLEIRGKKQIEEIIESLKKEFEN